MKIRHYLITRFNLGYEKHVSSDFIRWHKERLKLFEAFCLRSVNGQNNKAFEWLIFIDSNSPRFFKDNLLGLTKASEVSIQIVESDCGFDFGDYLKSFFKGIDRLGLDFVITTRLDSDDAVAYNFIDLIQSRFLPEHNSALNFENGIFYNIKMKVYARVRHRGNSFVSFVESAGAEIKTVYFQEHTYFKKHQSTVRIEKGFSWLVFIHSANDSSNFKYLPNFKRVDFFKNYTFDLDISLKQSIVVWFFILSRKIYRRILG